MTYKELHDRVLQLINQYSIAGTTVASSYNNQADYEARIPALANDGLDYIATTARRLRTTAELTGGDDYAAHWKIYALPDDFYSPAHAGVLTENQIGELYWDPRVRYIGRNHILVPKHVREPVTIEYYRYPVHIQNELSPDGDQLIDLPNEAAAALPYYIASHLVMADDAYIQATLYNEFENKLSRLGEPIVTEQMPMLDVYDARWGEYL